MSLLINQLSLTILLSDGIKLWVAKQHLHLLHLQVREILLQRILLRVVTGNLAIRRLLSKLKVAKELSQRDQLGQSIELHTVQEDVSTKLNLPQVLASMVITQEQF
jgi:hypothetical protein